MEKTIKPHLVSGAVHVPASKSHAIRALFIASCAAGVSVLENAPDSLDVRSCISACRALGASIEEVPYSAPHHRTLKITGCLPENRKDSQITVDVGNSGTTLFFGIAFAALSGAPTVFTGDSQTAARTAAPLLAALEALGAKTESRGGCVPITVRGTLRGGCAVLPCPTSQYLSALLLALPLCPAGIRSKITVPILNEAPYIKMTENYLKKRLFPQTRFPELPPDGRAPFTIVLEGGACYTPFTANIPGDFSGAAFPACAAAITGGSVFLSPLDFDDVQGDKIIFRLLENVLEEIIVWEGRSALVPAGKGRPPKLAPLGTVDLNTSPDLLPVLASLACYCEGESRLVNAAHARIKETDRIAVMAAELSKLGADIEELPDGLVIRGGKKLRGGRVSGRGDHRIVMALTAAALGAEGAVTIEGAETVDISFPGFLDWADPALRAH